MSWSLYAQPKRAYDESESLQTSAKQYIKSGDYANAIMVYNQLIDLYPERFSFKRQLAQVYFMQGNLKGTEQALLPLLKDKDADEETYQLACLFYTANKNPDDAKDIINKGIQKFPNAGMLYKEKGDLLTLLQKYEEAAKTWEKGVEKDPSFPINYYNLSKVYYFTKKYFWAIYYGESFINLESYSARSEDTKKVMYESYKLLISELNALALDGKSDKYAEPKNFEEAALQTFQEVRKTVSGGINVEKLTMLRVRFLLNWNKNFAAKYPCELFDHQQRMLLNGLYDAYNQWFFGRQDNEKQFISWAKNNSELMNRFDEYFRKNRLQPKANQFYNNH